MGSTSGSLYGEYLIELWFFDGFLGIAPVVLQILVHQTHIKSLKLGNIGSTLDPLEIFPSACDDQSKGDGPAARKLVPWLLMDPAKEEMKHHEAIVCG